ncbi:uncharacterized protein (DUF433 family) [Crossiella equi]|uniref:Uncharacterized protein (DUF433 family) n=1 Tax=Crossiella equi TaxID=130796 RepID=A0ABS5AH92_9PSEU|nr:DUF433 domain-containing protein [Crossiella equi]MBP2475716.1 uncharacterized protein (DUF433 family) [Crossiella equi]
MALNQISQQQGVENGVPYITGTAVPVATVNALLSQGLTPPEILQRHPDLTPEDIDACSEFARNGGR